MFNRDKLHTVLSENVIHNADLFLIEIATEEHCVVYHSSQDQGYHPYGNDWWYNGQSPFSFKYLSIDSLYPTEYFDPHGGHPDDSASVAIYEYMQSVYSTLFGKNFSTIIELGTGGGEITQQWHKHGLDYLAVEGTQAGVQRLVASGIDPNRICHANLKFLDYQNRSFDIAMCTEVAEHIEPFYASKVVDNCIKHSDLVWFSAADRNRHAHYHHMNELDIEVWDNLFANMGHNFFIPLNGLCGRASRLYVSQRIGNLVKEQLDHIKFAQIEETIKTTIGYEHFEWYKKHLKS